LSESTRDTVEQHASVAAACKPAAWQALVVFYLLAFGIRWVLETSCDYLALARPGWLSLAGRFRGVFTGDWGWTEWSYIITRSAAGVAAGLLGMIGLLRPRSAAALLSIHCGFMGVAVIAGAIQWFEYVPAYHLATNLFWLGEELGRLAWPLSGLIFASHPARFKHPLRVLAGVFLLGHVAPPLFNIVYDSAKTRVFWGRLSVSQVPIWEVLGIVALAGIAWIMLRFPRLFRWCIAAGLLGIVLSTIYAMRRWMTYHSFEDIFELAQPLLQPAFLLTMAVAALVLVRREPVVRHDGSSCRSCGYNLTGNVSGKCPECGAVVSIA